jgi:hypothetical protein
MPPRLELPGPVSPRGLDVLAFWSAVMKCVVEQLRYGPVVVKFPNHPGLELFMQSDWDYVAFSYNCGAPIGSGDPSSKEFNEAAWVEFDIESITECLDDYLGVATAVTEEPVC